jgi:hypothetical protein
VSATFDAVLDMPTASLNAVIAVAMTIRPMAVAASISSNVKPSSERYERIASS